MSYYSIKDLEKLSGIKAHTIRIWEKRYNVITPQRSDTNIRYYTDSDLKKILNISILNSNGVKISQIAELGLDELSTKVSELSQIKSDFEIEIEKLIITMIDIDESSFIDQLSNIILKNGFEDAIVNIVYPFLERIGILWITGNIHPAQEHFITNLLRQKIIVATDSLPIPKDSSPKYLLYLRENELHELSLLFYNYVIRKNGNGTIYLGQSVPFSDLQKVVERLNPQTLVTALIATLPDETFQGYIDQLSEAFPDKRILISGAQALNNDLEVSSNTHIFSSLKELKNIIS